MNSVNRRASLNEPFAIVGGEALANWKVPPLHRRAPFHLRSAGGAHLRNRNHFLPEKGLEMMVIAQMENLL